MNPHYLKITTAVKLCLVILILVKPVDGECNWTVDAIRTLTAFGKTKPAGESITKFDSLQNVNDRVTGLDATGLFSGTDVSSMVLMCFATLDFYFKPVMAAYTMNTIILLK